MEKEKITLEKWFCTQCVKTIFSREYEAPKTCPACGAEHTLTKISDVFSPSFLRFSSCNFF